MVNVFKSAVALAVASTAPSALAQIGPLEPGGKLLLTRGISSVDGAGGGGLTPWALITGNETDRGVGATAHLSHVRVNDFSLTSYGAAIGLRDRLEVSWSRQELDTREAGEALGLGESFSFGQDIYGAKLRLIGDAVYDQDRWLPQVAAGVLWKQSDEPDLVRALGAEDDNGIDLYLSATKLILSQSLIANATLRYSDANQGGLLGYGGLEGASIQPEVSLGYLVTRKLAVGGEYRFKPDNLAFAREDDFMDLFAAYAVNPALTLTAGYAGLGSVATFDGQRGVYLSAQIGF